MKKNTIVCPNCGTEISFVNNASKRLALLKNAGVDVSGLFAMQNGEDIARIENGVIAIIPKNDAIFAKIKEEGTINNEHLFRRWVMAQVLRMLVSPQGFHQSLLDKGYEYMFRMVEEEMRVQAHIFHKDKEGYAERNRFFNQTVLRDIVYEDIENLENFCKNNIPQKKCKGVPYIKYKKNNIFVDDIRKKIIYPLNHYAWDLSPTREPSADKMYAIIKEYNKKRSALPYRTKMPESFIIAYKGAGAYFTLKNCILFHGIRIEGDADRSMEILNQKAEEYKNEGYKLFGYMKHIFELNHFDIKAKIAEWSKK